MSPRDPHDAEMVWRSPMMQPERTWRTHVLVDSQVHRELIDACESAARIIREKYPNYPPDEDMA